MIHFKSLSELHRSYGMPLPEHPLLSIYSFEGPPEMFPMNISAFTGDFYHIALKKVRSGKILYGRTRYDHENGCMAFGKPRQIIALDNIKYEEKGFFICFHEDYVLGSKVFNEIKSYGYFNYEVNEALHISPDEEATLIMLFKKIEEEYHNNQDEMSREIILAHLSSMLKYAQRFYKRQFINRTEVHSEIKSRFDAALENYFAGIKVETEGLPSVNALAAELAISAQYLSDLLKIHTGKTAMEHIHIFLINEAKNLLLEPDTRISDAAHRLGFEHIPYFSRLFKKKVGMSPKEYKEKYA